jgi:hypothetical protein
VYKLQRISKKGPCTVKFTHFSANISGISCRPVKNEDIQSPEATVTDGGINWKHANIYLEPTQKGQWGFDLSISVEENSETEASQQVRIE